MSVVDTSQKIAFDMTRDSAFSYRCNACSRCCHHKGIRVGPYEILRLARFLGLTTTDFIARHTEAGGTMLRASNVDGACVFLTPQGCGVHPDRPLVCRIYPLGRTVDGDGEERFGHLAPHPQTAGVYGTSATVADYIEQQQLAPYFRTSDRYAALYTRMLGLLASVDAEEFEQIEARRDELAETEPGIAISDWIDIDRTVAEFCKARGRALPVGIDDTFNMHIEAVEAWLEAL